MPVIALVGNKGGAGKTTLAFNFAAGLAKHSTSVVIDADPQGSAIQWNAFTGNISNTVLEARDDLKNQLDELAKEYRYIILDCPPSVLAPQTIKVLEISDLALIPVQPSPVDLWATVHTEKAILEAQQLNPKLQAILVINQLEKRTTLSGLVRDALSEINLPVAKNALRRRSVFRNSALEGKNVFEMGHRGIEAAREVEELIQEVIKI